MVFKCCLEIVELIKFRIMLKLGYFLLKMV